jgi:hypothetical protein
LVVNVVGVMMGRVVVMAGVVVVGVVKMSVMAAVAATSAVESSGQGWTTFVER